MQEVARERATARPVTSSHGKNFLESFTKGIGFIGSASYSKSVAPDLLVAARAKLAQGSGAAQPNVTAGIAVPQIFQRADHARHGNFMRLPAGHCWNHVSVRHGGHTWHHRRQAVSIA